jgi:hypothetical protein
VSWTLGPTVGASLQVLEAGAGGTAVTSFTASGILTAGSITLLHGDGQSGYAGLMLTPSPSVFVRTPAPSAQLVAGVVVDWSVLAGGGSISADRVFTNAAGVSSVDWTLGSSLGVGSQGLRASVPGLAAPEVTFQATAVARPASIVKVSGDLQTGTMGTALPQPLQVRVLDTSGAPMEGVQLEWDHGYVTLDDWFAKHAFQSNTTDAVGEASIKITRKGEIASDSAEAVRAYVVDAKDVVATFWLNVLTDPSGTAGATAGDRWLIDSP